MSQPVDYCLQEATSARPGKKVKEKSKIQSPQAKITALSLLYHNENRRNLPGLTDTQKQTLISISNILFRNYSDELLRTVSATLNSIKANLLIKEEKIEDKKQKEKFKNFYEPLLVMFPGEDPFENPPQQRLMQRWRNRRRQQRRQQQLLRLQRPQEG